MNTLTLLFCFTLNAVIDTCYCNTEVILIPKHYSIPYYEENDNGNIIGYLINDTITEDYFIGVIYDIKGDYSYIKGSYVLDTVDIAGWIETKYLGIYLVLEKNVPLYYKPNVLSKKKMIIDPECIH